MGSAHKSGIRLEACTFSNFFLVLHLDWQMESRTCGPPGPPRGRRYCRLRLRASLRRDESEAQEKYDAMNPRRRKSKLQVASFETE
jgi:hypothetical protein